MQEEVYGIDKAHAHSRAIELIPEEFFWDCIDELAPFGSDEGDMALSEFREWKKDNPNLPVYDCLQWTIESVSEKSISDYNEAILNVDLIKRQITNREFDDQQYIWVVDTSVIAVGFGQLVDEGKIDDRNKPLVQLAIDRQKLWAELNVGWDYKDQYLSNLGVLERVLKVA